MNGLLRSDRLASLMLRVGLAFVFGYAGLMSIIHPLEWVGFLPGFIGKLVDPIVVLRATAVFEIILSLWLLSGRFTKYAAALSALLLAGITLPNLNELIVTFRDVGLLCAALGLFFMSDL